MSDPRLACDIARLAGLELSRVAFGPGWTQLDFTGEHNAFLQINTQIEVRAQTTDFVIYEPGRQSLQPTSSRVVALRGDTVKTAKLSSTQLSLVFLGGSELRVLLNPEDFEPILFSGSHHLSPGQLSWHHVVTAGGAP